MDGISLLKAALEHDADLVGIIMTGEGTITSAVEAMKVGALDYILKPFKVSVILPVLSRALAMRRLRLENAALQQRVSSVRRKSRWPTRSWTRLRVRWRTISRLPRGTWPDSRNCSSTTIQRELHPTAQRYVRTISDASVRMVV